MKAHLFMAAAACTVFASSCVTDPEAHSRLEVGDLLPEFSVVLSDGRVISSASLRGKWGVIEFFNTECGDCRKSLPELQQVYDSLAGRQDVEFLCIAREENASSIAGYWSENNLTLPWSPQSGREVYSLFASVGIPRLYVVGPDGRLKALFGPDDRPTVAELITLLSRP